MGLVCHRLLKAKDPGRQAKTMGNKFGRRKSAETSRPETDGDDKGHVFLLLHTIIIETLFYMLPIADWSVESAARES